MTEINRETKEQLLQEKMQEAVNQHLKKIDNETELPKGFKPAVVYKEPANGKTFPVTYICDDCGRKKTVRFKTVPTPASIGRCPRCEEGRMYSDFITKEMILWEKEYLSKI